MSILSGLLSAKLFFTLGQLPDKTIGAAPKEMGVTLYI